MPWSNHIYDEPICGQITHLIRLSRSDLISVVPGQIDHRKTYVRSDAIRLSRSEQSCDEYVGLICGTNDILNHLVSSSDKKITTVWDQREYDKKD